MKDYSLSRTFRSNNVIALENIQGIEPQKKVGFASLGYSTIESWHSSSNTSYTAAVNNTNVTVYGVSSNWWSYFHEGTSSDGYYHHTYNFLRFDTNSILTQYGISASNIISVNLCLENSISLQQLPVGASFTLKACVDSTIRALTNSVLSSGNYANATNQAIFSYQKRSDSPNKIYTINYKSGTGFKNTFNWTGTTMLALWATLSNPSNYLLNSVWGGSLNIYFKY